MLLWQAEGKVGNLLQKMKRALSLRFSFQQVMQAVQVRSSNRILAKKTKIALDSGLIFQRLIAICSDDGLNDALKHEQVYYHTSLLNDQKFMQDSTKSELADFTFNK